MRDHKPSGDKAAPDAGEQQSEGLGTAQMRDMQMRQWAKNTRSQLKLQADRGVEALSMGANIFQMAVRGLDEKQLQKKLEIDVAETLKDKLVDKITEKFKEGVIEASDIGTEVAQRSVSIFGTLKGQISDHIKAQKELSVLQVADSVTAAMMANASKLKQSLHAMIDGIPRSKVLAVRASLKKFRGVSDGADGEDEGSLQQGMEEDFMMRVLGMPAGDSVAAEQYAVHAFATFQEGVRGTMTTVEAGKAIQDRLANPNGDQEAIEGAEDKMGDGFKKDLQRDKALRARVANT